MLVITDRHAAQSLRDSDSIRVSLGETGLRAELGVKL